jgi:hypothetical protein
MADTRRLAVAQNRVGVDVHALAGHHAEAGLHRARSEGPRDLRWRVLELLVHVGCGRDLRRDAVVDGEPLVRLAELLDQPIDLRLATAPGERGLEHLFEAVAEEPGAAVQLAGQPLALVDELEVRERAHHHQGGDPERRHQPELEPQFRPPVAALSARVARSWWTSETSCSREAALEAGTASPTQMVRVWPLSPRRRACTLRGQERPRLR